MGKAFPPRLEAPVLLKSDYDCAQAFHYKGGRGSRTMQGRLSTDLPWRESWGGQEGKEGVSPSGSLGWGGVGWGQAAPGQRSWDEAVKQQEGVRGEKKREESDTKRVPGSRLPREGRVCVGGMGGACQQRDVS